MDYPGEHLLPGQLGNFFIILSLISSLLSGIGYYSATKDENNINRNKWTRFARMAFTVNVASVAAIFLLLFYITSNHFFEYKYVWQHSSKSLEPKYLMACFWEGQEGSFLLWNAWHCILGLVLTRNAKDWEGPVMTIVCLAQICLASMIAGIDVFGFKIGSNPFTLLRNEIAAPIFSNPGYLSFIKDGNGLNPLLQNYWMVIHPPVLFMGFASSIIPFAYAIAGLWTRKYKEWIKPALPWALFSAAILGAGIMMGAMWAYESLTFGGYWAWDPVENASLVPWLVLVAGIHTAVIYLHTGRSLRVTFFLIISAFLLILYSTFLTRSGILGDSSVHAFTDLGMNFQLIIFLLVFIVPSSFLYISRYRSLPSIVKKEDPTSREFWMFVGTLVLLISAIIIIFMTSVPVINKITGFFTGQGKNLSRPYAIGENAEYSYNRVQVFTAISIGLLTAIIQYLKYKSTSWKYFVGKIKIPVLISLCACIIIFTIGDIKYDKHGKIFLACTWVAIASAIFSIIANISYIWVGLKGNLKSAGAAIAHAGFGIMLLGILISSTKKEILSINNNDDSGENFTLMQGSRASMGPYWVTYETDSVHPAKPQWFYTIKFENKINQQGFNLVPNAFVNYKGAEGLISNPDAQHYWNYDIFSYITSLPDPAANEDTTQFEVIKLRQGDTAYFPGGLFVLERIQSKQNVQVAGLLSTDTASIAIISTFSKNKTVQIAEPILVQRRGASYFLQDTIHESGMIFQLGSIENNIAGIGYKRIPKAIKYLTLKVYKFPFINLVWIGAFVTITGFFTCYWKRRKF